MSLLCPITRPFVCIGLALNNSLTRYIIGKQFQHWNHIPQCETRYFKGTISRNFPDAIGPTNPVATSRPREVALGTKDQSSRRVMDQVLGVMRVPETKLLCSSPSLFNLHFHIEWEGKENNNNVESCMWYAYYGSSVQLLM
jgi:hypothetical protein